MKLGNGVVSVNDIYWKHIFLLGYVTDIYTRVASAGSQFTTIILQTINKNVFNVRIERKW